MYKKILVAVDGYEPSLGAAKRAVELAAEYKLQVMLLQVEEAVPLLPEEHKMGVGVQQKPITTKALELVTAYAKKHHVTVETRLKKGRITACILKAATDYQADLIILGDSGRKGLEKFYFGSVAQAVSENAPSSVLVVKKGTVNIADMVSLLPGLKDVVEPALPVFRPEAFRRNRGFVLILSIVFTMLYAVAVALTSEPLKEIAVLMIWGLPLAIWAGLLLFAGGLIIIRMKIVKGGGG